MTRRRRRPLTMAALRLKLAGAVFRDKLLMRAFGRPEGLLGRIGGRLMVRGKADCGAG